MVLFQGIWIIFIYFLSLKPLTPSPDSVVSFSYTESKSSSSHFNEVLHSFYFSEEILSTLDRKKNIKVRDRATLFNLLIGLNGYTVSSGIISKELNGENIIAKPLMVDEYMKIGVIVPKNAVLSRYANTYLEALKRHI